MMIDGLEEASRAHQHTIPAQAIGTVAVVLASVALAWAGQTAYRTHQPSSLPTASDDA